MSTKSLTLAAGLFLLMAAWLVVEPAVAQVRQPATSPYAKVSEEVGLTDITVKYCRPGVKGRTIWGDGALVPNGLSTPFPNFGSGNPFPWRGGANENTTISFENDMLIEGQKLAAGTYGLHMIPSDTDWTIIFSENTESWGSFFYDQYEDVLRVTVTPEKAPFKERLVYEFMDQDGKGGATIALLWEEMKVPFRVQVDNYHDVVMASMRNELRSRSGFGWQGYVQAANYALANDLDLEQSLAWADKAIQNGQNFNTYRLKSRILDKQGKGDASHAAMGEAIAVANENQLNAYGYQLVGQEKMDEALRIFKLNVERHPESWNPHDSLAECYGKMGDTKNAKKYYKIALDKLPEGDQANQDRITKTLAEIDTQGSN